MTLDENPAEAIYTLHFMSRLEPPSRLAGLKLLYCKEFEQSFFLSEWLIVRPEFEKIEKRIPTFAVKMRQFRVHKPEKDKWCVVDWKLLTKAIKYGYTIEV